MHYVHQDGATVFKFAVRKMEDDLPAGAGAQRSGGRRRRPVRGRTRANLRIILGTADRLGLDRSRVVINIDRFGNTTAATIPLALEDARADGRLKKGDRVLLASVGAGFTVGAVLLLGLRPAPEPR